VTKDDITLAIAEAHEAMQLAEHGRCLELLEPIASGQTEAFAQALLLRGRCLLARNPGLAVAALKEGSLFITDFTEEHVEAQILLGRAYAFTDQFEFAAATLQRALARAREMGSTRLQAYAGFNMATLLWMRSDHAEAEVYARLAAIDVHPLAQARAKMITSWLRAGRDDFAGQLALVVEALRCLKASPTKDVALEAWLTHVLAVLGAELCDAEALQLAWRQAEELRWTADVRVPQFQTLRALGTAAALTGDRLAVVRHLRKAVELAPSAAWKALAHLNLARLLREFDNWSWDAELDLAHEAAADVDWQSLRGEEQEALVLFIQLFSHARLPLAGQYATLLHTAAPLESRYSYRWDPRLSAHRDFALGSMLKAEGDAYLARTYYESAWKIYDRIGYAWRAAETALAMLDVCDPPDAYRWLSRANRILSVAPESWIAGHLANRAAAPSTGEVKLNPGPARVLQLLLQGKTTKEICDALGLSRHTVNKHVAIIKRSYGVTSLNQLLTGAFRQQSA